MVYTDDMTLQEYLRKYKIRRADFAVEIGVSVTAIGRYCAFERFPSTPIRRRIFEATKGKVTANDFEVSAA